jgi:dTDP-4-amino-4,6-dideoxygalactose transaminase
LEEEILAVVRTALHTGRFVGGPEVEEFEKEWAAFCRTQYSVAVSSGTDALRFALIAAGIGKGDLVLTVPNTFIATTEAISQSGARFDFVDIDERTYNMDPELLRKYLATHTGVKAVVPVHLYGQMADMDPILELAEKYNLIVIEDACQAHGAEYFSRKHQKWFRAGSMGKAAAFSFYPGKNLGACGEGGAVTTNNAEIAKKIRMLRDHGQSKKYYHEMEGYNGRLDAIQCGILRVKLRHLEKWNQQRRGAAERYATLLKGVVLPYEPEWSRAVYHLYVIRTQTRDLGGDIGTGLHYPVPLHQQHAYTGFGHYPVTEKVASEILSLPMFPQITPEQQNQVASALLQTKHQSSSGS